MFFLLFTYENGCAINPNSYSRAFHSLIERHNKTVDELLEKNGKLSRCVCLPPMRLYDGRHNFATNTMLVEKENFFLIFPKRGVAN